MTKKITKVAMTTAIAAAAIVPAVVAAPASAADVKELAAAKVYYTVENGVASFPAGDLNDIIAATKNANVAYIEAVNGEAFLMSDFTDFFISTGGTLSAEQVLAGLSNAKVALTTDQVKALNVKEGKVVDGKITVEKEGEVKPPVEAPQSLQIITEEKIIADGVTTQVVTFNLLDKNGELDKEANNVVLDLNSTYGFLSQKRLTMQHGTGQVILRSEFLANETVAKIDAQIIEAEDNYKNLIGKIVATKNITFVPAGSGSTGEVVKLKSVVAANSNQADRVTLTFDEEMTVADFYLLNANGTGLQLNNKNEPILRNNVIINQTNSNVDTNKVIKAVMIDPKNKKNVVVVLEKDQHLIDNNDVYVSYTDVVNDVKKPSKVSFKLADARVSNVTSVDYVSPREITATFSEATHSAEFIIDARFKKDTFDVKFGDVEYVNGAWVDTRHVAKITLNKNYQEPEKIKNKDGQEVYKYPAGYFASGKHAIEVSTIKDFAALTDPKNIGTTQVLEFDVPTDNQQVTLARFVDSPEQYRVLGDKDFEFKDGKKFEDVVEFQVWNSEYKNTDGTLGGWENVKAHNFGGEKADYKVTRGKDSKGQSTNEYKIELTKDWTVIYDTAKTKNNYYNDTFRLFVPAEALLTASNGKFNEKEIDLRLSTINSKDTALATPDISSPVINDIVAIKDKTAAAKGKSVVNYFEVEMSEPVKLNNKKDESGEDTLAQQQGSQLPATQVEFLGTYTNPTTGVTKTYTFPGKVNGFVDNFVNNKINVMWEDTTGITINNKTIKNPQDLVDAGGSQDWKVVVKSISDDVGNTAATVDRAFKLEPTEVAPLGKFQVLPTGGSAIGDGKWSGSTVNGTNNEFAVKGEVGDKVYITYTDSVAVTGLGSATNVKNYTLNGKELPVNTTIALAENDDKTVVISLDKGTLAETGSKNESNVITLAKNIVSKKGEVLSYDLSFTFNTGDATTPPPPVVNFAELTKSIEAAEKALAGVEDAQKPALQTAIDAAKAVKDTKDATQADVDAAKAALDKAVEDAKETGDAKVKTVEELGLGTIIRVVEVAGKTSFVFKEPTLPEDFKSAESEYVLTFDGKEVPFAVQGDKMIAIVDFLGKTDDPKVKAATITSK